MFVAVATRTMANAKPKFREQPKPVAQTVPVPQIVVDREADEREAVARLLEQYREVSLTLGRKSVRQIIFETALAHGVRPEEIVGPSRMKKIVLARHLAMQRTHFERPDLSLVQIGKAFGDRDHTTIIHAIRKGKQEAA